LPTEKFPDTFLTPLFARQSNARIERPGPLSGATNGLLEVRDRPRDPQYPNRGNDEAGGERKPREPPGEAEGHHREVLMLIVDEAITGVPHPA